VLTAFLGEQDQQQEADFCWILVTLPDVSRLTSKRLGLVVRHEGASLRLYEVYRPFNGGPFYSEDLAKVH